MELNYVLEIHFKSGMTFPMPPVSLEMALYAAGSVITTECVKSVSVRCLTNGEIDEINSTMKEAMHAMEMQPMGENPEADEGMAQD